MPEKTYTTPLVKKLGIRAGHRLLLLHPPEDFPSLLVGLPPDVDADEPETADVIVLFATRAGDLKREFARTKKRLDVNGGLWVAWPKKTSGVETDVTFEVVQPVGLQAGLVDNKVCAIDATWTALRFVYRKADRKNPSRTGAA